MRGVGLAAPNQSKEKKEFLLSTVTAPYDGNCFSLSAHQSEMNYIEQVFVLSSSSCSSNRVKET